MILGAQTARNCRVTANPVLTFSTVLPTRSFAMKVSVLAGR